MFKRFKKKPKTHPQPASAVRSDLLISVLKQYEDFEQRGLLCIAPLQHRVTVAQELAALFSKDAETLQNFLNGVSLYGIYELSRLLTNQILAKVELEAKEAKRKQLGRELTQEEASVARMQAFANSNAFDIINKDIYFDVTIVTPQQEPVVIARVENGKVEILSVKE